MIDKGMRASGTVKFFHETRGFGFITPDGEDKDLFVHWRAIQGPRTMPRLMEGERVEFTVAAHPKGLQAANVVRVGVDPYRH